MDLCSITPVYQAAWMYEMPRVMLLTHLVEKYPEYVEAALKYPQTYKILDNSLIELGGALNMDRLVKAAEKIQANEIVLPDVFKDGKATIESAKLSIKWLKEHNLLGKYKINVVCHGNDMEEWEKYFKILDSIPEVDVISIPKVTATWLKEHNRKNLYNIFKNTKKEIHFLGSWYSLSEILNLGDDCWNKVRSVDTCLPSLCVIQNISIIEDRSGTIDLEKNYPELTKEKYECVLNKFEDETVRSYLHICY